MKTILTFAIFFISRLAFAGTVTLAWDANPASDFVSGYELQWGEQSGVYTQRLDVGGATTFDVPNLPQGRTFFFTVRAYNEEGFSGPSNEVSTRIIGVPGAPQLLKITAKRLTQLDDKLRVEKKHFVMFKQGVAPNYPTRILGSRQLLDLSMLAKDATIP